MNNPLLSVIVPIYNVEKYLPRCIESILQQTYSNYELVLVVDGSPDHSEDICYDYASKDNRIHTYVKKNGGVSSARNFGLEKSKGEWIVFIDSDDWVEKTYLEKLVSGISTDIDIVELRQKVIQKLDFYSYLSDDFLFSIWNMMFRRSVLKDISFNEKLRIGEDIVFLLHVFKRSKNIQLVQSFKLYNYMVREDSAMHTLQSHIDSDLYLSDFIYQVVGSDVLYIPIYYRLLADNRNERDKSKVRQLMHKTIGRIDLGDFVQLLFKDPILLCKCIVRSLLAYL